VTAPLDHDDEDVVRLQSHVHDRLQEALTGVEQHDDALRSGMLNGWVVVSEWLGVDGDRYLDVLTSHDARTWEVLGWLNYAAENAKVQIQGFYDDDE
jgi:hypothetical protein